MNPKRSIFVALIGAALTLETNAALVVEQTPSTPVKVGGWTINKAAAATISTESVSTQSAAPEPAQAAPTQAPRSAIEPEIRLASVPAYLLDSTITVHPTSESRVIAGRTQSDGDRHYYMLKRDAADAVSTAFDVIARPDVGQPHFSYVIPNSSVDAPRTASKITALQAAADRFEGALVGNIEQRIAAIYALNKEVLDYGEYSSGLWLAIPIGTNPFNPGTASRIVSELGEFGSAQLQDAPVVDRAPQPISQPQPIYEPEFEQHDRDGDGTASSQTCSNFDFEAGLLKENIARFLGRCGYTIGQWRFGDAEYEYDMEIPKSYLFEGVGIEALLQMIAETYLVEGTMNTLDKTVDFEPARGDVLDGMEIEKW